MESNNNLTNYIQATISHWVGKNFGSQELDNPSWNIEALSSYLARELGKRESKLKGLMPYELTVLFRTDCDESSALAEVERIIKQYGGEIINEENDGKKRLAYKIQNEEFAIYYYLDIMIPSDAPAKLSSWLNLEDEVLRYLLVRKDTRRR